MTKTEKARELLALAMDEAREPLERWEALLAVEALRKEMKVGWAKVHPTFGPHSYDDLLQRIKEQVKDEDHADYPEDETEIEEMDAGRVARALMHKTVENGCTEGEESAAVDKLLQLVAKHKLDPFEFSPSPSAMKRRAASEAPKDEPKPEATEPTGAPSTVERGAIGALCRDLIMDGSLSYEDIAIEVRSRFPGAKTTPRSLASVAADLRRLGWAVPNRRKGA